MRKKLETLLPEIQLIDDADLRERTTRVWVEAMKRGNWQIRDLPEMPFTLLIQKTDVSLIQHTRAVTRTALKIAEVLIKEYGKRVAIDRDHLLAGAILHDVGKLFEYRREAGKFVKSREGELLRHPISGAAFAAERGLPPEVLHIIAAHSKEGDGARRTIEAVIVNHADFVNFDVLK
jgi:putative nucleotidyltransferase with HDIG domain